MGRHLPVDEPYLYPVSGGSEAIETALKLARATQLARGEAGPAPRLRPLGELPREHARRARPVRPPAAAAPVRAVARPVPPRLGGVPVSRRRCPARRRSASTEELAAELEASILEAGASNVAAFVGEPIVGATLGAVEPPDGYWPAIAEVCRRHGVLLVADEVMTGFGRTGAWFGMDHYGVRPDMLVAAKGATSGYWPFGFVAASGDVYDAVAGGGGFVHGFTYSHQPVAAAVAREVLRILEGESLVEASRGPRASGSWRSCARGSATTRAVGDIRGRGLLVGVELVRDRATKAPFPRAARLVEAVVRIARERGLLLYSGTGQRERRRRGHRPAGARRSW